MEALDLQPSPTALRCCSGRRSRSPLFSSTGRRSRRSGNRSCCRMRSAFRPCSSDWRTIATLFASTRILPYASSLRFCSRPWWRSLSLSIALLLAVQADKPLRGGGVYRTLLIWPYAVAPAVAGVLWVFMFQPSFGLLGARPARTRYRLESAAQRQSRDDHGCAAAAWKQISYNFLFFLAGLAAIPRSVLEAAAIDGARPARRFWTIVFPLLSPTTFFLIVVNIVYAFFDTFGIIDAMTGGGPAKATETLVYKVYFDGRLGGDLGGSAAQSVILMIIVIGLTAIQFRYVERKVTY